MGMLPQVPIVARRELLQGLAQDGAERPTVWIPAYRAPAKLVKVVVR